MDDSNFPPSSLILQALASLQRVTEAWKEATCSRACNFEAAEPPLSKEYEENPCFVSV